MAFGGGVLKEAAICAAGDKHQLDVKAVENMLRTFLCAKTKEVIHFFLADLHHICLAQTPQQLLSGFRQIAP